ncbi:iron ABC transporter permease [Campylobacter sp. MIT 12-8780]|uniref:iron chelate uptake ABC transporter family permease subunit n=1 Tax=Campylobacter sp. MIT 12-8780 TaxID=2202200 RepID=UPI00115CE9EF|nr:iron chelate uptake ABC transporter family permease subunit [Campylobacter sp. MIT 12-8780]TQR41274.1 iron ABC transporter permease [Campylobacter sp. MIT 12-8780]
MRKKLFITAFITLVCILIYIFSFMGKFPEFVIKERTISILAIILVATCIAICTLIFQTITNNKILTPSIIGLDSLYLLVQSFLVFMLTATHVSVYDERVNFLTSVICMIAFGIVFYKILFKENRSIYHILLLGLIFGTFFSSLSSFFEVLIDPDEFLVVQGRMFASFNNVKIELLALSYILFIGIFIYMLSYFKFLDILALGKDISINLGLEYENLVKRFLIIIAVLISISTALVGPITFLGLLVTNLSYELFKTSKHSILLVACTLVSIIALVGGTYLVARVFAFNATLSVVINFIGGIYFIYLVLKGNRL